MRATRAKGKAENQMLVDTNGLQEMLCAGRPAAVKIGTEAGAMEKKSFILYCDYLEHIQMLNDAEAGKLFKAILQYAVDGTAADLPGASGMACSP